MNAVSGTIFSAKFPIFTGSRFSPKFLKDVTVKARITKDSVYDSNNKHWIYFEVLESDDQAQYEIGKQYKKQGKNFYDQVTEFTYPENYEEVAELKSYRKMAHGLMPRGY